MIQVSHLIAILGVVKIVSLLLFGADKLKSINSGWRMPESRLLLAALCGPFGAFAGMMLFRHRTRKVKFLLAPIYMLIQIGVLLYFRLI